MSIALYNTLTRRKEPFAPQSDDGSVTMYVCGPTVYSYPHIGNARPAVVFDVLARLLRARYTLTYARNITDVDDKINQAAQEQGVDIDSIASRFAAEYHRDMTALGVASPDIEPRATQHIPQMIAMIEALIASGHAYAAEQHVLFRVRAFDGYGRLSRRDQRELIAGARVDVAPYKEDSGDFVLWKPSTEQLPGWDSPWGRGRPGWHIECSVMAAEHLGTTIDIHGGGNDLIFPHHENELAQSICAHDGAEFSRFWLHNGFVNIDATKMSKSLGNVVLVRELLDRAPGEAIRLALLSAHYRQPLDWSDATLDEARRKLDRLYGVLRDIDGWQGAWRDATIDHECLRALEDDLNTPRALAALFDVARDANKSDNDEERAQRAAVLRVSAEMLGILGQDPSEWFQSATSGSVDGGAIERLIAARADARARGDYAEADRIRDELAAQGVTIEDSAGGTRWRRTGS